MITGKTELEADGKSTLNQRQRTVLREVCNLFISTGVPVGSRTISRSSELACSPATIRNEMADLELMGYLYAPHTSAGRVPTEKGYRFYVNFLIEYQRISLLEESLIKKIASVSRVNHLKQQEILKSAVQFACDETQLPGMVLLPQQSRSQLQSIKLIRVYENRAILITVDESGNINDQLVTIPAETSDDVIEKLSILLNAQLCNYNNHFYEQQFIEKTRKIIENYNNLLSRLVMKVESAVKDPDSNSIFFEGFINFFSQPEFKDTEKMKQLITLLDQKEIMLKILAKSLESKEEIMVNIGSESGLAIKDLSLVTARYEGPNKTFGKIGLLGPLRMDYSRVVATLARLSNTLSQLLIGEID